MLAANPLGPVDSPSAESHPVLSGHPEVRVAILCLFTYAVLFLWVFGLAELRERFSLPRYCLCISEYGSPAAPLPAACQVGSCSAIRPEQESRGPLR